MNFVKGLHHITAIASDPKATVYFYSHILGLRLVKKTVNQDDVQTYHLFFGDESGEPGMDLTFFTFQPVMKGVRGVGQVTAISLAVPHTSLSFWQERFKKYGVKQEPLHTSFGTERVVFYDQDDQRFELVGVEDKVLAATQSHPWVTSEVSEKVAIRYFYSAKLSAASSALLEPVLINALNYEQHGHEQNTTQLLVPEGHRAQYLELEESPESEGGAPGAGTVHHIAFEVATEKEQLKVRDKVVHLGLYPTAVIDRFYFKSVYFRTPAGILFELATSGPGFTADESQDTLGKKLALPPFLEPYRREIEAGLEPLES